MNFILRITNTLSIPWFLLRLFRSPRILLYHGVTKENSFFGIENYRKKLIPKESFLRQIQFLKNHFRIVPLEKLIETSFQSPKQAEGMLAITFDDGYQNIFSVAWPILKKYNIPFSIFLTTDFIEKQKPLWVDRLEYAISKTEKERLNIKRDKGKLSFPLTSFKEKMRADSKIRDYLKLIPEKEKQELIEEIVKECGTDLDNYLSKEPNYKPLNWDELREMINSGLLTIGSHTKNHAIATRISSQEFEKDLLESKRIIEERLRVNCLTFAYPNGKKRDFSKETTEILKKNGFKIALTTEMEFIGGKSNPLMLSRLAMGETEDKRMFLATISGLRAFLRKIRSFIMPSDKEEKIDPAKYFDRQAGEYDLSYSALTPKGYSFRIRRQRITELLNNLPQESKVLDAGCGPAVYTQALLNLGFEVWGIDPAPEMIELAKKIFTNNSQVHFSVGKVESLPFEDKSFDAVIAAGVFEYFDDLKPGLKEVRRVLSSQGKFIITFPFVWSLSRIWDRLVIQPIAKVIRIFHKKPKKINSREFSTKQIIEKLKENGFSVEKIVFYNARLIWTPFDRFFPGFSVRLSKFFENLTPYFLKTGFIIRAKPNY